MKKVFARTVLILMLLSICFGQEAMAQRHHYSRPGRPAHSYRHHSTTDNVLRGMEAAETVYEYAMLGTFLNSIDDYTGLRLGYNSASLRASGFDDATTDPISGINLGIVFGWYLGHSPLSLEPGLYYSMKGGKLRERLSYSRNSQSYAIDDTKLTMHSFEIPFVLKAHLPIAPASSLQPFAGAFMSFGFAGTTTYDDGDKYDTFDDGILEDFDAGLRFGAGLSVDHFYLEAAYDLGLVNLCDSYVWGNHPQLRSNTWSFSVGFNF